ncbi:actin nucleation-promoting factor WAS-like isoform X6 [Ornithodoros turicata]|uniref:actin nucleation-promoting factor WAS-like isoform X6 n=1 Tax=Ornithodoros turicata TaxID=34597 RepID=UPI0031391E1D
MSHPRSYRSLPGAKASMFLTDDKNEALAIACNDRKWEILAVGVAEVYKPGPSGHDTWSRAHCGVVCFIKDFAAKAFFIRVFDFDRNDFVLEQKRSRGFCYKAPLCCFHMFEADDCEVGLKFAYEEEALSFHASVKEKLESRERKQEGANGISKQHLSRKQNRRKKQIEPSFTKKGIGLPMDFKHAHVGWDPTKGFDLHDVVDMELNNFFKRAEVSEEDLEDASTRKFIYDFIEKNGGISVLKGASNPHHVSAWEKQKVSRWLLDQEAREPMMKEKERKGQRKGSAFNTVLEMRAPMSPSESKVKSTHPCKVPIEPFPKYFSGYVAAFLHKQTTASLTGLWDRRSLGRPHTFPHDLTLGNKRELCQCDMPKQWPRRRHHKFQAEK